MTVTVMTVEFGTVYQNSSVEKKIKAVWTDTIWTMCELWNILFKNNHVSNGNMKTS